MKNVSKPNSDPENPVPPVPRISIQAFLESSAIAQAIESAAQDRRMNKAHVKIHIGGIPAAIEAYRTASTPNLIVLESSADRDLLFEQLDQLAECCDPGTKVMVIGHLNDIMLYRALIASGVSDYVVSPVDALGLIRHIAALYSGASAESIGRLIAVTGAKGGVGASTISHNLAWSISKGLDRQTLLVDMDLPFGTVGLDFNQDPPQGVAEAVFSPDRIDANFVDRLSSKCSDTLSILAAPATVERTYDLTDLAFDPTLDVLRSSIPCGVLDLPHQWCGWTKRVLVTSDEVVIVASPDLANLRNAKTIVEALRAARANDRPPRLILNMVGVPRRPEISVGDFAKAVELEPIGVIPFDAKLFGAATNNGQMLAEVDPASKIVEALDDMGQVLMGRSVGRRAKKTLFGPLIEKFGRLKAS